LKHKINLFFIEVWNWNEKLIEQKDKRNQKNEDQNWNKKQNFFLIEMWNWKEKPF
jgi:hypothetical protein